ncbi:MAG: hypothetical protein QXZ70_01795 [Candidatus Bathyarchaeia archaeon]
MEKLTNDQVRELILNFLYNNWKKARSLKGLGVTSGEIKKELKKYGLKENQIITNLDFLIKNGWIEERISKYELPEKKISVEKRTFHLSYIGLRYFEKNSKFDTTGKFSGILFKDIKDSIIVIGTGNVVQKNFYDLYSALEDLKSKIMLSDLPENLKIDYIADVESFKAQLAKPIPEKSIIRKIWEKLSELSKIGSFATLIEKIYHLLEFLLK